MDKQGFWDDKRHIHWLVISLIIVSAILFLLDFVLHPHHHSDWENWPGFYAVFGFVATVVLALVARYVFRPLLSRKEDYYDN